MINGQSEDSLPVEVITQVLLIVCTTVLTLESLLHFEHIL